MNQGWKLTRLGNVLRSVSRPVLLRAEKTYSLVGAHWYAKGLYVKEQKSGGEIQAKTLFEIKEGDFVYNRLFAWKGSFAVATKDVDSCLVSNEFPCFVPLDAVDPKFLWFYFSRASAWSDALGLSTGSTPTSRNRLKEGQFLNIELQLPPLDEQRRIVARIEDLAGRLRKALELRDQASNDRDHLPVVMAHRYDLSPEDKHRQEWREVKLGDILRQVNDVHRVKANASYPNLGIYSFGRGLFKKAPIEGLSTKAEKLYRVRSGQFIYSRLFAFEGAYGWVSDEYDGYFVSAEYPVFECDPTRVKPEFLYAYFKSPLTWQELAIGSKGLGHRRQRVKPDHLLSHRLQLPPLECQKQISNVIRTSVSLRQLQSQTAAELNALMPSILAKAFRGEL